MEDVGAWDPYHHYFSDRKIERNLAPPPAISFSSYGLILMESTILSILVVFGFVEAVVLAGEQNIKCHIRCINTIYQNDSSAHFGSNRIYLKSGALSPIFLSC